MKALVAIIFGLAFIPQLVSAQAQLTLLIDSGTTLSVSPNTPGPNEPVSARLTSTNLDLDISFITWTLNGKIQQSGQGEKTFNFTSGDLGSRILLVASIDTPNGKITKVYDFTVGEVDLIWEGGGYVPPFYNGRGIWARQGQLRLMAIPTSSKSPKSLIYKWSVDGKVLGNSSGLGKNSLTVYDTILSLPRTISVTVWEDQDNLIAESTAVISPVAPKVYIYEAHPLYGFLFNRPVMGTYGMSEQEITLTAFPFFFNADNRLNPGITYTWKTNDGTVSNTNSVTYRSPSSNGSASVNLSAKSINNLLQTASNSFLLKFGK